MARVVGRSAGDVEAGKLDNECRGDRARLGPRFRGDLGGVRAPRGNPGAPRGMAAAYDDHHPDIPEGSVYEEVPLSDLEFCEDDDMYYYECPCGDMFEISTVRARV